MRILTLIAAMLLSSVAIAAGPVLYIDMVWIPFEGAASATTHKADRIRTVYADAAQCAAAVDGEMRLRWTNKPGHRLLSVERCTDGVPPTDISIEEFSVSVVQTVPNQ